MAQPRSTRPIADELPGILQERGWSVAELARRTGVDKAHLSRALRGVDYKRASGDLVGRIAVALDLPRDYWPEYREAVVIKRIRNDARLRDELYDRSG